MTKLEVACRLVGSRVEWNPCHPGPYCGEFYAAQDVLKLWAEIDAKAREQADQLRFFHALFKSPPKWPARQTDEDTNVYSVGYNEALAEVQAAFNEAATALEAPHA